VVEAEDEEKSRKSIPHSTSRCNQEGLLESQIKSRKQLNAGITKSFKKRHMKELPISTREAIVKMYLDDHVFQSDIAKYYKISASLVSKLVVEAQRNPERNLALKVKKDEIKQVKDAVKRVVTCMLGHSTASENHNEGRSGPWLPVSEEGTCVGQLR
jgi:transposase-like protein